jgi:hypothetical protein
MMSPTLTFDAEKVMLLAVGFFICAVNGNEMTDNKRTM